MMIYGDGIKLFSTSHAVAPWYRRLWLWLWRRDISPAALETIDIEIMTHSQPNTALCPEVGDK